jgi:hypothetical protein
MRLAGVDGGGERRWNRRVTLSRRVYRMRGRSSARIVSVQWAISRKGRCATYSSLGFQFLFFPLPSPKFEIWSGRPRPEGLVLLQVRTNADAPLWSRGRRLLSSCTRNIDPAGSILETNVSPPLCTTCRNGGRHLPLAVPLPAMRTASRRLYCNRRRWGESGRYDSPSVGIVRKTKGKKLQVHSIGGSQPSGLHRSLSTEKTGPSPGSCFFPFPR